MPNIALEKPGLAPAQVIVHATGIGTDPGDTFTFKAMDMRFRFWSPSTETTGDGDLTPIWENNSLLYGTWRLLGAMVAAQAIGVANLIVAANNPILSDVNFHVGPDQQFDMRILVESIEVAWRRNAEFVGVVLTGKSTDQDPAEA